MATAWQRGSPFADQQNELAGEPLEPSREEVARAFAAHILRLNDERQDNYREAATHAFDDARESFRLADGALPRPGDDPLFDGLTMVIARIEASPEAVRLACEELLGAT
jgi:hypothetical protein